MNIVNADGRQNIFGQKGSVGLIGHDARMDATNGRGTALLVVKDVGFVSQYHFITPTAMCHLADQVTHGAAGDQESRFFAHPLGRQRFQSSNGGIFPENIVPDFRSSHGLAHGRGGQGNGV